MSEECVLYERICVNCGECEICDLDSTQRCSNCGRCLDDSQEYRTVKVDEFVKMQEEKRKDKR